MGMEQRKKCACKGIRSCLLCESGPEQTAVAAASSFRDPPTSTTIFYQCHCCGKILRGDEAVPDLEGKPLLKCIAGTCGPELKIIRAKKEGVELDDLSVVPEGVIVVKEFVGREKEREIVLEIDKSQWAESQSGRRKQVGQIYVYGERITPKFLNSAGYISIMYIVVLQDYGPKVNFKRQKVKLGSFNGLPPFSEGLVKRMQSEVAELRGFTPVELCNLDYSPERGSAIDPHVDDNWIWGERLVTLNLLSPTYLTFSNNSIQLLPPDSHTPTIKVLHCFSQALHAYCMQLPAL